MLRGRGRSLAAVEAFVMPARGVPRRTAYPLRGESHFNSKLSDEAVQEIRRSSESCYTLGARYAVSHTCVVLVRRRETWRHV